MKTKQKLYQIKQEYSENKKDVWTGSFENFLYGFIGSTIVVFISLKVDIAVLISYLLYYFYVGKVINRPKYATSLGKFIVFPVPTALGAFIGYKVAQHIGSLLDTFSY